MAPYRTVLVGTDGSPSASEAVRTASGLAKAFDATLIVLTAFSGTSDGGADDVFGLWERGRPHIGEEAPDEFRWATTADTAARERIDAATAIADDVGVDSVRVLIAAGEPASVILKTAERENADLIVIGSKQTTVLERLVEGSIPGIVAHNAPCDLIIVPGS